jgi:two-component system, NarL family, response regulator LiaR
LKRSVVLYGISLALLVYLLKQIEYRYYVREIQLEFYVVLVAIIFATLGAWIGLRLIRKRDLTIAAEFTVNETSLKVTGISKREHEVLTLMSKGDSNQEIADKLFLSLNTVKTHSSNIYVKLGARRRTQAVQRAKELRLIP